MRRTAPSRFSCVARWWRCADSGRATLVYKLSWATSTPIRIASPAGSQSSTETGSDSCCRGWCPWVPVLLGGTSNHFRADLLRAAGSWDAFNVTEDADLGIRLARLGYRIAVLDSETEEEANSDFINWVKQRSRWYKGYLQTWLVHTRSPAAINRELGWRGVLALHLFVAGTPLTALINPIFWALSIVWFAQKPEWLAALFPPAVFYVALACFVLGNAAMVYTNVLTVRVMNQPTLLAAAFTMPLYWVMMSAAAAKAMFQLVWHPFYWEKTVHGLFSDVAADVAQSKARQ